PDLELQKRKVANLHAIMTTARRMSLIIVSGTERNKHGLPFVDDLDNEFLAPIADDIREGALALCGHTAMARFVDRPLTGEWARDKFADDAASRNRFYSAVGRLLEPGAGAADTLRAACASDSPEDILAKLGEA
ncbi:MAG: hypothetical protein ACYS9X_27680, partial [Planctomycetota bacterium]